MTSGEARLGMAVCMVLVCGCMSLGRAAAPISRTCTEAVVEGEVRAGESYTQRLGGGLLVRLEAVPGGWVVRILPEGQARPAEDYAELATPPYRSVNPLRITTEFGFRAQDAVGWNPRRFRFASGERMFREFESAYHGLGLSPSSPAPGAEARLGALVSAAPEGSILLLDARLVPGTGDQSTAASLVSTHFGTTPHTAEDGGANRSPALGRLSWIRFRMRLELARRGPPVSGVRVGTIPCNTAR